MKKVISKVLKKIVFAFGLIYGINFFLNSVGVYIPLNIFTVLMTSVLGTPGILSIFAIFYLIK